VNEIDSLIVEPGLQKRASSKEFVKMYNVLEMTKWLVFRHFAN